MKRTTGLITEVLESIYHKNYKTLKLNRTSYMEISMVNIYCWGHNILMDINLSIGPTKGIALNSHKKDKKIEMSIINMGIDNLSINQLMHYCRSLKSIAIHTFYWIGMVYFRWNHKTSINLQIKSKLNKESSTRRMFYLKAHSNPMSMRQRKLQTRYIMPDSNMKYILPMIHKECRLSYSLYIFPMINLHRIHHHRLMCKRIGVVD